MNYFRKILFLPILYIVLTSQTCNNNSSAEEQTVDVLWTLIECNSLDDGVKAWNQRCNWPAGGASNTFYDDLLDIWPWSEGVQFDCNEYADLKERLHPFSNIKVEGPDIGDFEQYGEQELENRILQANMSPFNQNNNVFYIPVKVKEGSITEVISDWCTCCKECNLFEPGNPDDPFDQGTIIDNEKGSLFVHFYEMFLYSDFVDVIEFGVPYSVYPIRLSCPYAIFPGHPWWQDTCPFG